MIINNSSILGGNANGASLNIDYGSTPPTDTTKLWVPLAQKPNAINVDFRADIGSITQEHHPVTAANMTNGMALCETEDYIYVFGGVATAYTYVSKRVYRISKSTWVQEDITSQITLPAYPAGMAPCVYYNGCIYIVGGHASYTSNCYMRNQQIMKVDLSTNTATVVYQQLTSQSNLEPWAYASAFLWGDKIIIAGGSPSYNEVNFNYHGSDFVRVFDPVTNSIEKYRCPGSPVQALYYTTDKVIFSKQASAPYVYEFDLNTKQFTARNTAPSSFYNGNVYKQFRVGETPYLITGTTPANINQYNKETMTQSVAATISSAPNVNLGASFLANHLSWFANAGVLYTKFNFELETGVLFVNTDYTDDVWEAIKGKGTSLYACPLAVYLGDDNGIAQEQTAYLYDAAAGEWKSLSGESYTNDMVNALNILGVN